MSNELNNLTAFMHPVPGKGRVILVYPMSVEEDIGERYPACRYLVTDDQTNYAWHAEKAIAKGEILFMLSVDHARLALAEKNIPYELMYPRMDDTMFELFTNRAKAIREGHWAIAYFNMVWRRSLRYLTMERRAIAHHVLTPERSSFTELLLAGAI